MTDRTVVSVAVNVSLRLQRVWFGVDSLGAKPAGGKQAKDVVTGAPFRLNWSSFWGALQSLAATPTMVWNKVTVEELRASLLSAELGLDRRRRMAKRKDPHDAATPSAGDGMCPFEGLCHSYGRDVVWVHCGVTCWACRVGLLILSKSTALLTFWLYLLLTVAQHWSRRCCYARCWDS